MAIIDEVADGLAQRTMRLVQAGEGDDLEKRVAEIIGQLSPTLQEAYSTAMRIRRAEARGHQYLEKLERGRPSLPPPKKDEASA